MDFGGGVKALMAVYALVGPAVKVVAGNLT